MKNVDCCAIANNGRWNTLFVLLPFPVAVNWAIKLLWADGLVSGSWQQPVSSACYAYIFAQVLCLLLPSRKPREATAVLRNAAH